MGSDSTTAQSTTYYNTISDDIWFHVSEHVAPEDVLAFALICRETTALVRSRKFWKHLYKKYCQKSYKEWILLLPERLQRDSIWNCDTQSLRYRVIEAFFYCHTPLVERLKHGYSLDSLRGHTYVSHTHHQCQCVWIMCYKFRNQITTSYANTDIPDKYALTPTLKVVNDWESLVNEDQDTCSRTTTAQLNAVIAQEGVSLLVIMCNRFIPFPAQLLYGSAESRVRLQSSRQMLSKDMRGSHLELDFVNSSKATTTVKYPNILKYKVLPWWHPDFRRFIK